MKTESSHELQAYEVSGQELRIHWGSEQKTRTMDEETIVYWEANEALCSKSDNRSMLISKIIGSVYSLDDEIAIINNKDRKPQQYAQYQEFRAQAKVLADGWLNTK